MRDFAIENSINVYETNTDWELLNQNLEEIPDTPYPQLRLGPSAIFDDGEMRGKTNVPTGNAKSRATGKTAVIDHYFWGDECVVSPHKYTRLLPHKLCISICKFEDFLG